jgi:O-antigen/teichoic acid export membrane protein
MPSPLLILGEVFARLSSFVTVLLVVRTTGLSTYGDLAIALAVLDYQLLLGDLGFSQVGTREIARNPDEARSLRVRVTKLRVPTTLVATALGLVVAFAAPGIDPAARDAIVVAAFGALSILILTDWALIGLGRNGAAGLARAVTSGSFLVLALAVTTLPDAGAVEFAGARVVSLLFGAALTWYLATRFFVGRRNHPVTISRGAMFRMAVQLGIAAIFIRVYNTADTIIIGLFRPAEEVGAYRAAYAIVLTPLGLIYLLNTVLLPRFSALHAADGAAFARAARRFVRIGTLASIVPAAALAATAPDLVPFLLGDDVGKTPDLVRQLSPVIVLDFWVSAYTLAFVAAGMTRVLLTGAAAAAVVNVVLNFALVPDFGAEGAVVATMVSYGVLISIYWIRSRTLESS